MNAIKKFFQNSSAHTAKPRTTRGFTLVELLVVVAIIAVLVALVFPLATGMINTAKRTKCVGNLRKLTRRSTKTKCPTPRHSTRTPL